MPKNNKLTQAVRKAENQVIQQEMRDFRSKKMKNRARRIRNRNKPKITQIGKNLRAIGASIGKPFGFGALGKSIGAGVSQIFGQGDYVINSPSYNSLLSSGVPSFSPLTSGFRVKHREYIQDISSSIVFNSNNFSINPGLSALFPWLSKIAANFEEYKIHGMIVYLNSLSATAVASTNTALGLWGAVTQYDPSEPAFTTKQQAENYVGCQTTVPSCNIVHGIECKPNINVLNKYFVRTGPITDAEDLKFYDIGQLQVFTQGSQAISNIGEMWVSYDIEFMKPRLATGNNAYAFSDIYVGNGAEAALPLGGALPLTGSNLGTLINPPNQLVIPSTLPLGLYALSCWWEQLTPGTVNGPNLTFANLTQVALYKNVVGANVAGFTNNSTSTSRVFLIWLFKKTVQAQGTITFANVTGLGVGSSVNLTVSKISDTLSPSLEEKRDRLDTDEIVLLRKLIKQHDYISKPLMEIEEQKENNEVDMMSIE